MDISVKFDLKYKAPVILKFGEAISLCIIIVCRMLQWTYLKDLFQWYYVYFPKLPFTWFTASCQNKLILHFVSSIHPEIPEIEKKGKRVTAGTSSLGGYGLSTNAPDEISDLANMHF